MDVDVGNLHRFGANIPYNPPKVIWPDTSKLYVASKRRKAYLDNFTMLLEAKPPPPKKVNIYFIRINGKII